VGGISLISSGYFEKHRVSSSGYYKLWLSETGVLQFKLEEFLHYYDRRGRGLLFSHSCSKPKMASYISARMYLLRQQICRHSLQTVKADLSFYARNLYLNKFNP